MRRIGKVLDAPAGAKGLADTTVVVLWGDTGGSLGDHGFAKHTNFELAARSAAADQVCRNRRQRQEVRCTVELMTLPDVGRGLRTADSAGGSMA